ncbi:putative non-specific serine/threonine protein kinase [Helianthus annuus]|nr:putative non-specific serine/threonine protein kinase [Helianthus annuus]KAJ0687824.1 putative non-specific serine/threonine protein kinase [Helianthus annuus]
MGLRGPFPIGVKNCTSLTGLDLSSNHLTGHIPSDVAHVLAFVTTVDLSNNNFSGPIPPGFGNLSFINVLRLDNNQLTGQIPPGLSELKRLKKFSVANNRLSGKVPIELQLYNFPADSYANNLELCGPPLSPCKHENRHGFFFTGFAVGLPVSTVLTILFIFCCLPRLSMSNMRFSLSMIKKTKRHLIPRNTRILLTKINNTEDSKIMTMEKYVRPLSLEEIKLASNDFDNKNEIGFGYMGVMYKARVAELAH